ncbi:MAG: hypothetical protein JKX81_16750 [Arenicella sp.]|nr:hypothetical protein [Arenicella sp.]
MRFILIVITLGLAACTPKGVDAPIAEPELPGLGSNHSTQMTAQECVKSGGLVVGDIGDGRVHSAGYLCDNGEVPLGTIVPIQGQPMATEGAVCCGG